MPLFEDLTAALARATAAHALVILVHTDPDADAIGAALAMRSYFISQNPDGPEPIIWLPGVSLDRFRYLPDYDVIVTDRFVPKATMALALDCATQGRLSGHLPASVPCINWDHHSDNTRYGTYNFIDGSMSSMGEFVTHYFDAIQYHPTADQATQLYTALVYDTGRFAFSNVTEKTLLMAAKLVKYGALPEPITQALYHTQSVAGLKTVGLVISRLVRNRQHRYVYSYIQASEPLVSQDALDSMRTLKNARVMLLFRAVSSDQKSDEAKVKISFRSVPPVDIATFAHQFNGGGHKYAAGAVIPGTLETVMPTVLTALDAYLTGV